MTGNYSTREYREKLYDDLHVRLRDTVILMCAIFIASIGLNMNSTAVIIGAMLISPLMTPIVGLGFGLAIFDTRLIKQSLEVYLPKYWSACLSRLCISGFLPYLMQVAS